MEDGDIDFFVVMKNWWCNEVCGSFIGRCVFFVVCKYELVGVFEIFCLLEYFIDVCVGVGIC